jgi:NitT/TauT family transport system substrate-binding protein
MRSEFSIFIFLVLICTACRNHVKSTSDRVFTIACLNGSSSMGLVQLIDSIKNYSSNDINIEILDQPMQVRKMMLDGTADFAFLPTTMAAILYNKGLDYKLIGIPVWGTLYLFGQDSSITNWKDLKNKTVNVMDKGMTPDILFQYLLKENGIDPDKDITLDYSFPTHIDLANAIAAGQVKLGVISEPLVSMVMNKNNNVHTIFDLNLEWNKLHGIPLAQTSFLGKGKILSNEPKKSEQIISACERSVQWVNNNPDSAASLITKYNILPDYKIAIDAIHRSNMNFKRAHDIQHEIEQYLSVFYTMNPNIIGGKMPDENFFY